MTTENIRLLIVDNQVDACEWLAEKLRMKYGFEVKTATDGAQCLELAKAAQGNFDVILMDLRLGRGPDGIEVMKEVQALYPAIETIIITGLGDVDEGVRAITEGAYGYLFKPRQDEELVVYIRSAAERRNLRLKLQLSERERDWLHGLLTVGEAVTSSLDPKRVARTVYEQIQRLLPHMTAFYIATYDESSDVVQFILTIDRGEKVEHPSRHLDNPEHWGLTGLIIKRRQPIFSHDLMAEQDRFNGQSFFFNEPARSYLGFPLINHGTLIGVLSAQSYEPNAFSEDHKRLLQAIANQVAVNLENALLNEQAQVSIQQLEALDSVALDITKQLDIKELLQAVIERANDLLHGSGGGVYLKTEMGEQLRLEASCGMDISDVGTYVNACEGVVGQVIRTMQPFAKSKYHEWEGRLKSLDKYRLTGVVGVPIYSGDHLIGVLVVHDTKEGRVFSVAEQKLLLLFGRHAGAAIENARIMDEQRVISDVTQALAAVLDYEELLNKILEVLLNWLGEDMACAILLKDKATNRLYIEAAQNYPEEIRLNTRIKIGGKKGVTGHVASTGEPLIVPDVKKDRRYVKGIANGRSEIAVPLIVRGKVTGVLDFESKKVNAFSEHHRRILTQAATVVARAIENAKLFKLKKERENALKVLHQVGVSIASSLDYKKVLRSVVEHGQTMLNAEVCALFLVPREDFLSLEADYGTSKGAYKVGFELAIKDEPRGGLTGAIAARGKLYNRHGKDLLNDPAIKSKGRQAHLPSGHCVSLLALPLMRRVGDHEELIGLLKVENKKDKDGQVNKALKFDSTDILILETLANYTVTAIENAQLFALADMSQKVGRVVRSTLDLNKVLELVLAELETVLPFDTASIQLLAGTSLKIVATKGFDAEKKRKVLRLAFPSTDPKFPNYRVLRDKRPFLLPDIHQTGYQHFWTEAHIYCSEHIRSWLGVPLLHDDNVIGMLSIESSTPRRYTNMHKDLGVAFASQVVPAIANAKLYQSSESMLSFIEDVTKQLELPIVLKRITEDAVNKDGPVGADIAIIYTYNPDKKVFLKPVLAGAPLHFPANLERPLHPKSAVYSILNSKRSRIKEDVTGDEILYRGFASKEGVKSVAAFPLLVERQPVGVMFFNFRSPHSFTPDVIERMKRFARDAAVHVQNAYKFETVNQRLQATRNAALALSAMSAWAHDASTHTRILWTDAMSLPAYIPKPHNLKTLEILDRIRHHSEKIATLILDTPDDIHRKKRVRLSHAFQRALELNEDILRNKKIKIEANLERLSPVLANEGCIIKAFGHLLKNAVRAMQDGGKLTLTGYRRGASIYVKVSDTGHGISLEKQETLFDLPGGSQSNGMGVGLPLTRIYLEACDGGIRLDHSDSQGSTFILNLPLAV